MTLTLTDVLLLIIAAATVGGFVMLVRLSGPVTRASAQVEETARHLNYLRPRIERLLEEAEAEVVQARQLTSKATAIATDLEVVSEHTRKTLIPALKGISAIAGPLQYIGAAVTGAKIGMKVLGKKHRNKQDDD